MVHILYDVLTIYILASSLPDQSKAITFFALKVHIRHLLFIYFLYTKMYRGIKRLNVAYPDES